MRIFKTKYYRSSTCSKFDLFLVSQVLIPINNILHVSELKNYMIYVWDFTTTSNFPKQIFAKKKVIKILTITV